MQVIFLLAGANKRFYPLNTESHKAMIPLYGKPILEHVITSLKEKNNITDFIFVIPTQDTVIRSHFQNGENIGVSIQYATLDNPDGQGAALLKASDLISEEFVVLNANHLDNEGLLTDIINFFHTENVDGVISGIYEENIQEYGALQLDGDKIVDIIEKPDRDKATSHYRATFAYILTKDFLSVLKEEQVEMYSFESAISKYVKNHIIKMYEIPKDKSLSTLKYPWHLFKIREQIGENIHGFISKSATIAKSAIIGEEVYVDDGAVIHEGVCIKGKTYIGKHAVIGNNSLIRDCDLADEVHVGFNSDITRSIIMKGTHSHGGGFIGDSIIGKGCRIAFGFVTANKRLDKEMIYGYIGSKKIEISNRFGIIMGNEVHTGIRVSTMPGVIIGNDKIIQPEISIKENII